MSRKIIAVFFLFSVFSAASLFAEDDKMRFDDDKSRLVVDIGFLYSDNPQILNLNFNALNYTFDQKLSYSMPFLPTSLVKRDSDEIWRYSFSGPVTVTMLTMRYFAQKIFYPNDTTSFMLQPKWFDYFLFLPNSAIKYKLKPTYSLGLSMKTDYLFVRTSGLDRGILFTPSVDFTFYPSGNNVDRGAFTISATYCSFLNFEGKNKNDGFGIKISSFINGLFN